MFAGSHVVYVVIAGSYPGNRPALFERFDCGATKDRLGGHDCICILAKVNHLLVGLAPPRFIGSAKVFKQCEQFLLENMLMGIGKYDARLHFSGIADGVTVGG